MTKKILLYNNFPFHCELFGFALDYAKEKDIIVDIFNPIDNLKYFQFYSIYFKFNIVKTFQQTTYDLIICLTDSDWSYKPEWVTPKTITLNHWYQKRNNYIPLQINCSPFISPFYTENFILPTLNIPDLTLETKLKVRPLDKTNVAILGRFIPDTLEDISHIKTKVIFHIVNCHGIHPCYKNQPNIVVYEEPISTIQLYNILINCEYIYVSNHNENHTKGYSTSASIALSFNTLCQLVIPKRMNQHLRLKSAILYEDGEDIELPHTPDYMLVFKERQYFIEMRDKILNALLYS